MKKLLVFTTLLLIIATDTSAYFLTCSAPTDNQKGLDPTSTDRCFTPAEDRRDRLCRLDAPHLFYKYVRGAGCDAFHARSLPPMYGFATRQECAHVCFPFMAALLRTKEEGSVPWKIAV